MNSYIARITVGALVVAATLGLISCAREEQPANQAANSATANTYDSPNSETLAMAPEEECNIKEIQARKKGVNEKIESKVKAKNSEKGLKVQWEAKNFEFITEVNDPNDPKSYLVVYVGGIIKGTQELKEFTDILNDFNKKDGCVSRVVFLPKESLQRRTFRTDPGFEWTYCPFDIQPCSDGSCGC